MKKVYVHTNMCCWSHLLPVCLALCYSKMSNNVPDKIKPFGTLRDFGAVHLGHYETFLFGHSLEPFGTLRDFFLGHYKTLWKIFLRTLRTPPP